MVGRRGLDSYESGLGSAAGPCEHGNELWVSQNAGNFLTS